jgi:hypothetical protein
MTASGRCDMTRSNTFTCDSSHHSDASRAMSTDHFAAAMSRKCKTRCERLEDLL